MSYPHLDFFKSPGLAWFSPHLEFSASRPQRGFQPQRIPQWFSAWIPTVDPICCLYGVNALGWPEFLSRASRQGIRPVTDVHQIRGLLARGGTGVPEGELYAIRPSRLVAGVYPDPSGALAVARRAGVQVLGAEPPRGQLPPFVDGLELDEFPAFMYPGRSQVDRSGAVGDAVTDMREPFVGRYIRVAGPPEEAMGTLVHEAGHLLDPLMYSSGKIPNRSFRARRYADDVGATPRDIKYWSDAAEVNATLSRLRQLFSAEEYMPTTPGQAGEMLEWAVSRTQPDANVLGPRAGWTARAVLNSRERDRLMPWMTGALGVGGVMAGSEE